MKNSTLGIQFSWLAAHASARRAVLCGLVLNAGLACAHDAMFEPAVPAASGQFVVRFSDDGKPLPYPPAKLTRVWAYNAAGQTVTLQPMPGDSFSRISAPADAALLALEFDNGFYSKTTQGTVNKPKNEAPSAVSALWAKKTGKYVIQWNGTVQKPLGMQLEIVPLSSGLPKAGDTLTVQVLWNGLPVEGLKVSKGEHDNGEKTDINGRATYRVQPGRNFIWTERRVKVSGDIDPRYDSLAVASNLIFVAN